VTKPVTPIFVHLHCEGGPATGVARASIPLAVGSPDFRVSGISVALPGSETEFHEDVFGFLRCLRGLYGPTLDDGQTVVVMHNAPLEYYVLFHQYGQMIRRIVDLRFMSYLVVGYSEDAGLSSLAARCGLLPQAKAVGPVGPSGRPSTQTYAVIDEIGIMQQLFTTLWPQVMRTPVEATIMSHTVRMFVESPLRIGSSAVEQGAAGLDDGIHRLLTEIGVTEEDILSNSRFKGLLSQSLSVTGRTIQMKEGRAGPVPALAHCDEQMQGLLQDFDPSVSQLVRLKLLVPLARRFRNDFDHLRSLELAANGRGHFELTYQRQVHGRFAGSGGFNIEAVPHAANQRDDLTRDAASCMRRAIAAPDGQVLVAADASQIEARILAWLAGEDNLHRAFSSGLDVYSSFASDVLGEPVRKPREGDPEYERMRALRTVGKTAILGLGYGMGVARFIKSLGENIETRQVLSAGILTDERCRSIVYGYRNAYYRTVEFWRDVESSFSLAIYGRPSSVRGVRFSGDKDAVCIELPSGRRLLYPGSRMVPCKVRERSYIDCNGLEAHSRNVDSQIVYGSGEDKLYGGKITEHIVSGIARDILVHAIVWLEKRGWRVVNHCYDEIICVTDPDRDNLCLADMILAWRCVPSWADGLILNAEGGSGRTFEDIGK
jgi:hypothetical protein